MIRISNDFDRSDRSGDDAADAAAGVRGDVERCSTVGHDADRRCPGGR
ncbi:hypothetical protein [Halomicrobium salinisoli]|nr:hypothetical protein [Halomicrobium salinisoli]